MRACVLALLVLLVAPAAADPGDPVRLRIGTLAIDGSRYMIDSLALGEEIARRTHGAVQLDWVANGQLGDEAAIAGLIARGELDGGGLGETGLTALVPEMAAWGAPGLLGSEAEVDRATAALDPTVRELFAQRGLQFAMWAELGFAEVFGARSAASASELLRVAAPWLAQPLDGALSDAITAGRAAGWAMPPLYMLAVGGSKARVMTDLHYRYVVGGLVFAGAAWARLSPAAQRTVLEVCRERAPRIRASWRRETARGVAALRKAGVAVVAATPAERAALAHREPATGLTAAILAAALVAH